MRILFLSLLITIFNVGIAQAKPVDSAMAEKYYADCLSKERPANLQEKSHEYLCGCTASKMIERMDTDDIAKMSSKDPAVAREAMNFMIVNIYAPCMEYPTKDHYFATCANNPNTKIISKDPSKLCSCMSEKIGTYIAQNGEDVFRDILTRNPNVMDPMSALESDPVFQDYTKKQAASCLF